MIFIDAIHVKIRDGKVANRPIYVALAVTAEGRRDILGLWAGEAPVGGATAGEGAKYWLHVLTEIKQPRRGRRAHGRLRRADRAYPTPICAVWPQTITQTCVVHYADSPDYAEVAADSVAEQRFRAGEVGIIR